MATSAVAMSGQTLLPIILIYTGFVYYLFRGKLKEGEGYH